MTAALAKNPDISWIALFKSDFTSKSFSNYVYSDDVFYWIKRSNNFRISTAKSTGNTYFMRDFKFYDKGLKECHISYKPSSWKCISIKELERDYFGSYCRITIQDPKKDSKHFYLNGNRASKTSLNENLYFSYILFILKSLDRYQDWNDLAVGADYNYEKYYRFEQIPDEIKEVVFNRFQNEIVWQVDNT